MPQLVKMLTNIAGPNVNCLAGGFARVSDSRAKELIEGNENGKYAVKATEADLVRKAKNNAPKLAPVAIEGAGN
jgi:hypothetical protein